jgi:hypothetical protein
MPSSELLHLVALVGTDVSEELSASIIRVTRIGELGTLTVTSNWRTLKRNTNIPKDGILHSHCRENLKSYRLYNELYHLLQWGTKIMIMTILYPILVSKIQDSNKDPMLTCILTQKCYFQYWNLNTYMIVTVCAQNLLVW